MKKNITPPFPRIGEIVRIITLAFDTKNSNKKIDELACGEDIKWHLTSELIQKHVFQPLKTSTNDDFAKDTKDFINHTINLYIEIIKVYPAYNLNRSQVLPTVIEHFFALRIHRFLKTMTRIHRGPNLSEMLNHKVNHFAYIFDWFYSNGSKELHKLAYPTAVNSDKVGRDNFLRWINSYDIPDSNSLKLFSDSLAKNCPDLDVAKLKPWLIIARAFAWVEKKYPELPLRNWIMRFETEPTFEPNVFKIIDSIIQVEDNRVMPIVKIAREITIGSNPLLIKENNAQEKIKLKIMELEKLLKIHDKEETLQYIIQWQWAQWHVLSGDYENAISRYKLAFEHAIYRAGEQQKQILKESLELAGHTQKKVFLNHLKHHAIAFGLLKNPVDPKSEVIEQWEYEQFAQNFKLSFPKEGRFYGAIEDVHIDQSLPFFLIDQKIINEKKPDLHKPDRVIKIFSVDKQEFRSPQLCSFASWGTKEAVNQLLKCGASVDQLDENGASALLRAIKHADQTGKTEVLEMLLQQPHQKATLDQLEPQKQINPLFCAVEYGEPKIVEQLLKMGASVDIKGNLDAKTPLYMCLEQIGSLLKTDLLPNLIENAVNGSWNAHQQDAMRRYGVSSSGTFGEKHGFNVALKDSRKRALLQKVIRRQIDETKSKWSLPKLLNITELLLEHGAQSNEAHSYPIRGFTPLMLAAENDSLESFQMMLRFGGNPYKEDSLGRNALQIAREFKSAKVLTFYLMSN